jgi:outer membrane lipoprotein-sorting protein
MLDGKSIAVCLVSFVSLLSDRSDAQPLAAKPGADALLKKVRDTYGGLSSYHLQHSLVAEELKEGGKRVKIAEVTLVTASEKSPRQAQVFEGLQPVDDWVDAQQAKRLPFNLDRRRFEVRHWRGDIVEVCDGKTSWLYVGATKEYRKGERALDVTGPTAATMHAALHGIPLTALIDESLKSPKLIREEEIEADGKKRACYVLQCTVKSPPAELPPGIETPEFLRDRNPLAGATGIVMQLQIHGLVEPGRGMNLPASDKAEWPSMTLWVDAQDSTVWRSQLVEKVQGVSMPAQQDAALEKTEVHVTDSFSVAKLNERLPDDLFRFTPPKGAQEVLQFTRQSPEAMEKRR